jgi:uncharacterized oxidoreductase
MKITGRTVLITGSTSGIGLGLAERFHAAGNRVVVAGRRAELLDEITARHDGMASVVLDVADPASITAARDQLARTHPDLDVVITTAGIMRSEDLRDPAHQATAEEVIQTNLLGTIRTVDAFLPGLLASDEATLMTVSSGLAFVPLPLTPTYNATKAAVHSYTQSLRAQLAGSPVEVVELVPPKVQTRLMPGQEDAGDAMPLDDFLDEVMGILQARPEDEEILVQDVHGLRFAERDGRHEEMLALLSGRLPAAR